METNPKTKRDFVRLKLSDTSEVMIEPEDEDRFVLTMEEAVHACKVYEDGKKLRFEKKFKELLGYLSQWSKDRNTKIAKAFLTIQDVGLLFIVMTVSEEYERVFIDELATLDWDIANNPDFEGMDLSVQSLPHCEEDNYTSFCNPSFTLELQP